MPGASLSLLPTTKPAMPTRYDVKIKGLAVNRNRPLLTALRGFPRTIPSCPWAWANRALWRCRRPAPRSTASSWNGSRPTQQAPGG